MAKDLIVRSSSAEFLIYTYWPNSTAETWNNRYLGLKEYYDECK